MLCPKCRSKSSVIDSRHMPNSDIRRRRECLSCGHKYTTLERLTAGIDHNNECKKCASDNTVVDSRVMIDGTTQRSRQCDYCGDRYSTIERLYVPAPQITVARKKMQEDFWYSGERIDTGDMIHGFLLVIKERYYIISKILTISDTPSKTKKCTIELLEVYKETIVKYNKEKDGNMK